MPFPPDADLLALALFLAGCGLLPALLALRAGAGREAWAGAGAEPGLPNGTLGGTSGATPGGIPMAGPLGAPFGAAAAAAVAGHGAVTALTWERGLWRIEARDVAGRRQRLRLDAWTGHLAVEAAADAVRDAAGRPGA
ncbi:hypothetical protein M0638_17530 [Roseomonas sp. NAR14]|uniref:PepSY domain-containing protein n=1 Tax=Roseomonas acroporae TaxID=2937791 RepID=A0A9X2BYM1_9PROT|nr:hypothetical protein [Roseomonas acroporae]MCK8786180.1 hypothetical protein [Roseomonas acroporae]